MMKPTLFARKLTTLHHSSPTFLLAVWFFIVLTIGTVLLALPWSHQTGGEEVTILTALFTAVSAFCVTGLTVVDTPAAFNTLGQVVILFLIELGGVGIMSFAALGFSIIGRRLPLAGRAALNDALFQNNPFLELKSIFRTIFTSVALIQTAGFALLYLAIVLRTPDDYALPHPAWSALFHSVSAFCNAGFSIYHGNLEPLAHNRLFLAVIMLLVVSGGLGFTVLAELQLFPRRLLKTEKRPRLLSANTRVVLITTTCLLVAGGGLAVLLDAVHGSGQGAFNALFHSVVARTAGFNSTALDSLPLPGCLLLCALMFVGGSPGSCAGGIKTTSTVIWLARIAANIKQSSDVTVLRYSIRPGLVSKARIIIALSSLWVIAGVTILACSEPGARLDQLLFEQISALATTGLSMGLTPSLNGFSQVWIILSMIMGKFGPLTVAMWVVAPQPQKVRCPEAALLV